MKLSRLLLPALAAGLLLGGSTVALAQSGAENNPSNGWIHQGGANGGWIHLAPVKPEPGAPPLAAKGTMMPQVPFYRLYPSTEYYQTFGPKTGWMREGVPPQASLQASPPSPPAPSTSPQG